MKHANPSDFIPTLTERMVSVFCKFPVQSVEHLIRSVEDRFCYEYNSLFTKLFDILEQSIKEIGAKITNTCVFDDVSVVVAYDDDIPLDTIKDKIARGCFHFWQQYLGFTREAQKALEAV